MKNLEVSDVAKQKGLAIKYFRQRKNWNQSQLAEESGISQVSISKIESGKVIPNGRTIIKLCSALGISEEELISNSFQLNNYGRDSYESKIAQMVTKLLLLQRDVKQ